MGFNLSGPLGIALNAVSQPASQAAPAVIPAQPNPASPPALPPDILTTDVLHQIPDQHMDMASEFSDSYSKWQAPLDWMLGNSVHPKDAFTLAELNEQTAPPPVPIVPPSSPPANAPVSGDVLYDPAHIAAGIQMMQKALPGDQYSGLIQQINQELQNRPAVPHYAPPQLSPVAAALGALGAAMGGRFAAQNVEGALQGGINANNVKFERQMQGYTAQEQQHQSNLQSLAGMADQQNARDRGVLSATETALREQILAQHYGQMDVDQLRRSYLSPNNNSPSDILYAGQALQGKAQQLGIMPPNDQDINGRVHEAGRRLASSLQQEITKAAYGAMGLSPGDSQAFQNQIDTLRSDVTGTDGTPLLSDQELPHIPTSQSIAQARQQVSQLRAKQSADEFDQRFQLEKGVKSDQEKALWVRIQEAQARVNALNAQGDSSAALQAQEARESLIQFGSELYRRAISQTKELDGQIAQLKDSPVAASRLMAQRQIWQNMADSAVNRLVANSPQIEADRSLALRALAMPGADATKIQEHYEQKWGLPLR